MRIAICDDERHFRSILKQKLEIYAKNRAMILIYDDFTDGSELLKSTRFYDLIFLDYQMNELNGMDTARQLRDKNNKTTIIFLTAVPDIVYDTFEVKAFRFLNKPIEDERLYKALDDFLKSFSDDEYLSLIERGKIVRIEYNDILYVEANGKKCLIHTINDTIEHTQFLLSVEGKLPKDRFFRCHKSFIVGFKHIVSRDGNEITLDNGDKVDLTKSKAESFKNQYIDYLKRYSFERG